MKYIELTLMLPLAVISLLLLMVVDLARAAKGKPTVDEEWHDIYMENNMNHGMGSK